MNRSMRPYIFIGIGIVLLGIAWAVYYSFFVFHVTGTNPGTNSIASLTPSMKVHVNKDIESIETIVASPDPNYIESYTFSGKEIHIVFNSLPTKERVTISIRNVRSTDGDTTSTTLSFTPADKKEDELPKEQYDEILERQDRDTAKNADPVQDVVPHSTLNYALTLTVNGRKPNGGNKYDIDARIILSQADINSGEQTSIDFYKADILSYLRQNNINPDDYQINYVVEYP